MSAASILIPAAFEAARLYLEYAERASRGDLSDAELASEWERVKGNVVNANLLWEAAEAP